MNQVATSADFRATVQAAAQTATVRAALRAKAARMLPRAQRTAYEAGAPGFAEALRLEEGVRPGTKADGFQRPFARLTAEVTDDMEKRDGGAKLTRTMILRRSARA